MITRAVNLRTTKFDVYIGRAGKGQDGYFGNPFVVGRVCSRCKKLHGNGDSTLACYKAYMLERIAKDEEFKQRLLALKGKALGCFCKPAGCHGDVIAEWVESV